MNGAPLLRFMMKRHQIHLRRQEEGGRGPWTDDPILQQYSFTNVYRELDRQTVLLRKHWRDPYADHPNLWFAMAMARQINWWPTLGEIGFPAQWNARYGAYVVETMRNRARRGDKVYTGAYMLRCDIQDTTTPDKPAYTVWKVLDPLWADKDRWPTAYPFLALGGADFFEALEKIPPKRRQVEAVHIWFMQHHGWGGFLSYEVVTDLMETRYLSEAEDRDLWAFAGPGAVRGLNRLLGRELKRSMPQAEALSLMVGLLKYLRAGWPADWPLLRLREVEHSLCEFDKYERVRLGQGKPRSKFRPQPELP